MKNILQCTILLTVLLHGIVAKSQYRFLTEAPAEKRLQVLWKYCVENFISDKDSAFTLQFFKGTARMADSLGDKQLKAYAQYFTICYRILFSEHYEQYFHEGDYKSVINVFDEAQLWAEENGFADIAASCQHYKGQVYFRVNRYGLAFEHLLKADEAFRKIGYNKVPAVSTYFYNLGLNYYLFEEYEKALKCFLSASNYPFYTERTELYTLNAIGLIYARRTDFKKAISFYRQTILKASANGDQAWIGIASGNLGNVFLAENKNDSALAYHRTNFHINNSDLAPEDAAKSALSMATVFIRKHQQDSALYYVHTGLELANKILKDPAENLEYQKRRLEVMINFFTVKGDYKNALHLTDSLAIIKKSLQQILDSKVLNRAVEKIEAESYQTQLKLLESQKGLNMLRYYLLIAALLSIMAIAALLFNRYRMRNLRQAQMAKKEKQLLSLEKVHAEEKLRYAEELLTAYLTTIKEKTTLIENLDAELNNLEKTKSNASGLSTIASNVVQLVSSTILTDDDWRRFRELFEQVHPGFSYRLKKEFPDLSPAETRLLILTKLSLSSREMANMLGISVDSIRKARYRLRKKFDLEEESKLDVLIQGI